LIGATLQPCRFQDIPAGKQVVAAGQCIRGLVMSKAPRLLEEESALTFLLVDETLVVVQVCCSGLRAYWQPNS
jgi:hypothetical protein